MNYLYFITCDRIFFIWGLCFMSKLVVGVSLISGITSLFSVSAAVENIEESRFEEQSYLRSLSEEDRRIYMGFAKRIEEKRNGSRINATKKQEEKEISHMPAKPIKTVVARKVAPKPSSGPATPSKTTPVVTQKPEVVEIKVEEKAPKTEVKRNRFAHLKCV